MTDYIEDPGWELYRSFLAVLQEGSLSAAARALGVTQPTIGRHIDALESALGFTLFTRSQHGFKPTEAALALGPHAENLALNAAALLRVASAHGGDGRAVRGTVRISASEVVGAEVLPPILTALRVAHPQLVIELVLSNRIDDLLLCAPRRIPAGSIAPPVPDGANHWRAAVAGWADQTDHRHLPRSSHGAA